MNERLSDERPSVRLYGEDGNVFSIIGRCTRAAREHGWNKERVDQFIEGCMAANNKLRMNAYYYGFDDTGIDAIDRILSAVACAGKAFHHTDCWNDEAKPYDGHFGRTPIEWIQNAADDAAKTLASGPMMPETPSDVMRDIVEDCLSGFGTVYQKDVERVWEAIRSALMQEQS